MYVWVVVEATKIEAKFYKEIHALECKYHGSTDQASTGWKSIKEGEASTC